MMNEEIGIQNEATHSFQQFIFPFMLEGDRTDSFAKRLVQEGFDFFDLDNTDLEDEYYGKHCISHRKLEKHYMPNVVQILFPPKVEQKEGIRRFSKKIDKKSIFKSPYLETDFVVDSLDIYICPFHIGLMNIRVTLPDTLFYDDILYFGNTFRILEPIAEDEEETKVCCGETEYKQVKEFIFNELIPPVKKYMDDEKDEASYFGSLPFFVDERMYVISYISVPAYRDITKQDLYRLSELNGYDEDGDRYVGALNPEYIERYYREKVYDRWGNETFYMLSEYHFACITKATGKLEEDLAREMYSQYFYMILLFFYYKMVLLKLVHDHAQIDMEKDRSATEMLIFMITEFSTKYLFTEVNSTATGKEMAKMANEIFRINPLYEEVKETLSYLYQNQEKLTGKSSYYLLEILTIYTVISGIYGMNLYIEDLKKWPSLESFSHYNLFEWVAVVVTITGLVISIVMGVLFLKKFFEEKRSRKKRIL